MEYEFPRLSLQKPCLSTSCLFISSTLLDNSCFSNNISAEPICQGESGKGSRKPFWQNHRRAKWSFIWTRKLGRCINKTVKKHPLLTWNINKQNIMCKNYILWKYLYNNSKFYPPLRDYLFNIVSLNKSYH